MLIDIYLHMEYDKRKKENITMRILIIEDEFNLADVIAARLKQENYEAEICQDGDEGLYLALAGIYDLILLDVMLPGKDGFEILRDLRQQGVRSKIIMLTARSMLEDKLAGLEHGANDYITKPFHMDELMARVRIQLSSPEACQDQNLLTYGDLSLDTASLKLSCKNSGQTVELVRKEYLMLEYFLQNPQQVLSKEQIFERVWGLDSEVESNNLEVYVSFVRRKIKAIESKVVIKAVRGVGYRMEVQE